VRVGRGLAAKEATFSLCDDEDAKLLIFHYSSGERVWGEVRCVSVQIPSRCPSPLAQRLKAVPTRFII
jgi:hypothetical protein